MFNRKTIIVTEHEFYDAETNRIVTYPQKELVFEHSLYTISKWEAITGNSYFDTFGANIRGVEDKDLLFVTYIKCMCLTEVDDVYFNFITEEQYKILGEYINKKMSATRINNGKHMSLDIITTEQLYAQMFSFYIPLECEHWHFSRLQMLLGVCVEMSKEQKPTKRTNRDISEQMRLNEERKKKMKSAG